jgi:hypothetical protein
MVMRVAPAASEGRIGRELQFARPETCECLIANRVYGD